MHLNVDGSVLAPAFTGGSSAVATYRLVAVSALGVTNTIRETSVTETSAWKVAHYCGYCKKSLIIFKALFQFKIVYLLVFGVNFTYQQLP